MYGYLQCDIAAIVERLSATERAIYDLQQNGSNTGGSGTPQCVPVSIKVQPQSQSLSEDAVLILSVQVNGTGPFSFQWKKNGVNIVDATTSSYVIQSVVTDDAGLYSVSVTNECGDVTSNVVTISVTDPVVMVRVYWGWVDNVNDLSTDLDIQNLQETDLVVEDSPVIIADFRSNSLPKILIMAQPVGEPLKIKWFGTFFNKGDIGVDDLNDLFPDPITVGSYSVYYTNYATQQQQTTIQFSTT